MKFSWLPSSVCNTTTVVVVIWLLSSIMFTITSAASAASSPAAAPPRPHLIYILIDDLGWSNIGFHNKAVLTPNVDALVQDGVELTNHYVYKFCSPTRSSVLSGRLPIHVNQENSATEQRYAGIPLGMTLISEQLKKAGYATAHAVSI